MVEPAIPGGSETLTVNWGAGSVTFYAAAVTQKGRSPEYVSGTQVTFLGGSDAERRSLLKFAAQAVATLPADIDEARRRRQESFLDVRYG